MHMPSLVVPPCCLKIFLDNEISRLLIVSMHRKNLKTRPTQVNLMLILALILSIVCFFLMDFFVSAEEDAAPSVPCSVVR